MAKAASRKLKVFQAQFGFFDSVVAASSQAAALRAWGTHQNLFADGQARVTTDAAAVTAALAHPEIPLRRALGSTGPFELEPAGLPVVPDEPTAKTSRKEVKPVPESKPRPDRRALDQAEAQLRTLDDDHKAEEVDFRQRQEALDQARAAARRDYGKARQSAEDAVAEERVAYREAGGES